MHKFNEEINSFVKSQKQLMGYLRQFKTHVNNIVPMKEQEVKYYKNFAEFLNKYEQGNQKSEATSPTIVGDKVVEVRMISGDSEQALMNNLENLSKDLRNPFKGIRNWVKGEVMNLEALMAAIGEKEACDMRRHNAVRRLEQDRALINSINQRKFTLQTLFKT
jgi:hypothetical protein